MIPFEEIKNHYMNREFDNSRILWFDRENDYLGILVKALEEAAVEKERWYDQSHPEYKTDMSNKHIERWVANVQEK